MKYHTFEVSYYKLDGLGFTDVVAISAEAAIADCVEAGLEVVSIQWIK